MSPILSPAREVSSRLREGVRAARTTYEQRRGRADHIGMANVLRAVLAPGDDAIDVGAHQGDVTRQILQSAPGGRVLAVEPLPHLARNLEHQLGSSVLVEQCALTDAEPGTASFLHVKNNPGYSGFRERDYPSEPEFEALTVQTHRLDDLVAKHSLRPKFIKIDVEGAELLVLRGAAATIAQFDPVIVVEHGTAAAGYGESAGSFFDLATELGLRVFNFDGDGPYQRGAFTAAVRPDGHFNFMLRR